MYITAHSQINFDEQEIISFLTKLGYLIKTIEVSSSWLVDNKPTARMVEKMVAFPPEFLDDFNVIMKNNPSWEQFAGRDVVQIFSAEYKKFVKRQMGI